MKCVLAVCAESASLDRSTNSVSIFNIVDSVSYLTFPHVIPKLSLLFIIQSEDGDGDLDEGFVSLDFEDQEKGKRRVIFDFEGKPRLRLIITAEGISIDKPGVLRSSVWHRDKEIGRWEVDVSHKVEQNAPSSSEPVSVQS